MNHMRGIHRESRLGLIGEFVAMQSTVGIRMLTKKSHQGDDNSFRYLIDNFEGFFLFMNRQSVFIHEN